MKVTLGVYIENLGDGSAWPRFFNTEEEAEVYAQQQEEEYCAERMCDDTGVVTLVFDEEGNLLNSDNN